MNKSWFYFHLLVKSLSKYDQPKDKDGQSKIVENICHAVGFLEFSSMKYGKTIENSRSNVTRGIHALFYDEKIYNGILMLSIFDSARAIFTSPSIKTVTSDATSEDSAFSPVQARSFLT